VRSTTAPYTESRLTRSVANERVGFPVVEQVVLTRDRLGSGPHVAEVHVHCTCGGVEGHLICFPMSNSLNVATIRPW
jgi:hypothetical protein